MVRTDFNLPYKILKLFCEASVCDMYAITVIPSTYFACLKVSRYAILKALHYLRDKGYIQNDTFGRPAVVSYGEYEELECEAMPPLRGFSLTSKAYKTTIYKLAEKEYMQGLADWENGYD